MSKTEPLDWLRWGGLTVILGLCISNNVAPPQGYWPVLPGWLSVLLYALVAAAFFWNTRPFPAKFYWQPWLLVAQTIVSLPLEGGIQIVATALIPLVIPRHQWARWFTAQALLIVAKFAIPLLGAVREHRAELPAETTWQMLLVLVSVGLFELIAWNGFACAAAMLMVRFDSERARLALLNAELLGSQVLLQDSSRLAERLRISRELHDSLGHHLTSLNLQLQIANHLPDDALRPQLSQAQFLAKLLLAEVRESVSQWRQETSPALPDALRTLFHGAVGMQVHLDLQAELPAAHSSIAHALFRCTQESYTNTLRHGVTARNFYVKLRQEGSQLVLKTSDDGAGCAVVKHGNGLAGIIGRVREHGGSVEFEIGSERRVRNPRSDSRARGKIFMIRLVLVEDETLVRLGLRQLLGFDKRFEVVADASDGVEALAVIAEHKPDVVLMDVRMPAGSGIDTLRTLRAQGNAVPVILITTFDDEEAFLQAIHAGASAFLRKDSSLEDLGNAIDAAYKGEHIYRPAITQVAMKRLFDLKANFESADLPDPLTKREIEVLRLMAAGMSNKEIAEALRAGEATVKTHASSILSKLGVRDRTRAVLRGLELGYV